MRRLLPSANGLALLLACACLLMLFGCSPTLPTRPTLPEPPPSLTKPLRPLPPPPTVQASSRGSWMWRKSMPSAATA